MGVDPIHPARAARGPSEWVVPARAEEVARLRAAVTDFARANGADDEVLGAVRLGVSEAASNAVLHGYVGMEPGVVRVAAEARDGEIVVVVADEGRGMQPRPDSPGMGVGLPTMGMVAAGMDVREGPGGVGTEVRLTFAAPGVRGPEAPPVDERGARVLAAASALVTADGWPGPGLDALLEVVVPELGDLVLVDLVQPDGTPHRVAGRAGAALGAAGAEYVRSGGPAETAGSPTYAVLRTGRTALYDVDAEMIASATTDDVQAQRARRLSLAWWLAVPISDGQRVLGVLGVGGTPDRARPDADLAGLVEQVGSRAADALGKAKVVGELQRTRRRLERVLGALAEAVTVQDDDGRIVYANRAAAQLLGHETPEEVLAAEPGELAARFRVTREDGTAPALDDYPGIRLLRGETDVTPVITRSVHLASGRAYWLRTSATLLDDDGEALAINVIQDITEAKEAELRQRFLTEAAKGLAGTRDALEALTRLTRLAVPDFADWAAVDVLRPDGTLERLGLAHADPEKEALGWDIHRRWPPDLDAPDGLPQVLRTGEPLLLPEVPDELLVAGAQDEEHLATARALGLRSGIVVALRTEGGITGALTFVHAESARAYAPADLVFAQDLADLAAWALDRAGG